MWNLLSRSFAGFWSRTAILASREGVLRPVQIRSAPIIRPDDRVIGVVITMWELSGPDSAAG